MRRWLTDGWTIGGAIELVGLLCAIYVVGSRVAGY